MTGGPRRGARGEPMAVAEGAARLAGQRWTSRPAASMLVRVAVLAVPFGAAVATGAAIGGLLAPPQGTAATAGWYAATLAGSLVVFVAFDRVARRLLPLALLLRLTLVFPDQAPLRLAVALGASSRTGLAAALTGVEDPAPDANLQSLVTLAAALNSHDRRTRGHSARVRALTDLVAVELGL